MRINSNNATLNKRIAPHNSTVNQLVGKIDRRNFWLST